MPIPLCFIEIIVEIVGHRSDERPKSDYYTMKRVLNALYFGNGQSTSPFSLLVGMRVRSLSRALILSLSLASLALNKRPVWNSGKVITLRSPLPTDSIQLNCTHRQNSILLLLFFFGFFVRNALHSIVRSLVSWFFFSSNEHFFRCFTCHSHYLCNARYSYLVHWRDVL